MGITHVTATVIGHSDTGEYTFLLQKESNYLALPMGEIEVLGVPGTRARVRVGSETGLVEVDTYFASGELNGEAFSAIMVPAEAPLFGAWLLENLRHRVDPATNEIEKVPDDEIHPPYLVSQWVPSSMPSGPDQP